MPWEKPSCRKPKRRHQLNKVSSGTTLDSLDTLSHDKLESLDTLSLDTLSLDTLRGYWIPRLTAVSDTPLLDFLLLATKAFGLTREELLLYGPMPLKGLPLATTKTMPKATSTPEQQLETQLHSLTHDLERRASGTPVAYITGHKAFRSLDFAVAPGVLVPRADTEILVECAVAEAKGIWESRGDSTKPLRIIDVCTGSGAIALSLAHELSGAAAPPSAATEQIATERIATEIHATDLSPLALGIAYKNAERFYQDGLLTSPPHFHHGDLLEAADIDAGDSASEEPRVTKGERSIIQKWDIIVSNPPYLLDRECEKICGKGWGEPDMALRGGDADGLAIIRRLIAQATQRMQKFAILAIEAAPEQMDAIEALLAAAGFDKILRHRDLAGDERVIQARWRG